MVFQSLFFWMTPIKPTAHLHGGPRHAVSILVLLDDSHQVPGGQAVQHPALVSILVLLDDSHQEGLRGAASGCEPVSILVLLDDSHQGDSGRDVRAPGRVSILVLLDDSHQGLFPTDAAENPPFLAANKNGPIFANENGTGSCARDCVWTGPTGASDRGRRGR